MTKLAVRQNSLVLALALLPGLLAPAVAGAQPTVDAENRETTVETIDSCGLPTLADVITSSTVLEMPATPAQREAVIQLIGEPTETQRRTPSGIVVTSSTTAIFAEVLGQDSVSLVARVEAGEQEASVEFEHKTECGEISFDILDGGQGGWMLFADPAIQPLTLSPPWAVDEAGTSLPTWFVARASTLIQVVDTSQASGVVLLDPTYTALSCPGHWSNLSAASYLDMDVADTAACPVKGMFRAAQDTGYWPVWGNQPSVADDYGLIIVRQDGGCTGLPDTGPTWDFQVPCKAHDYCYDLRKAGFSGTVSDFQCDAQFLKLMNADCNNRLLPLRAQCLNLAANAFAAVSLPNVVTNPNPGIVEIRSRATGKCADIEGPTWNNNTPIQQWSCVGVPNQRFRIYPAPGAPGYFQIKPVHSGMCARALTDPVQWACSNTWNSQRFRIQGALNQDQYSIRSKYHINECWHVPYSWTNGQDLTDPACNDYSNWFIWRIVNV